MPRILSLLVLWLVFAALGGCARRDLVLRDGPLSRTEAAAECAKVVGGSVRSYSSFDFGRERDARWQSVVVKEDEAERLVLELRKRVSPGVLVFVGTANWLGDERHSGVEVVFAEGSTQLDILRIARSDAINYDMDTEALVARLKKYDDDFGIDIIHAETDVVEFTLRQKPKDMNRFVEDLLMFCPDLAEASVDVLSTQILESMRVFLWWD